MFKYSQDADAHLQVYSLTCRGSLWQSLSRGTGCTRQGFCFDFGERLGRSLLRVNSVLALELESLQEGNFVEFLK